MTITIEIPPELEEKLSGGEIRQGLLIGDYVRQLLEERLATIEALPFWATATPEE